MNAQEGIKAIKELLGLQFNAPEPEEVVEPNTDAAFGESTLTDGTIIRYEKLEVGTSVEVVGVDGLMPAPDGAHETTDGTVIETKDGVITAITEAVTEPIEEAMKKADAELKFSELTNTIAELSNKLAAIESALNSTVQANENKFAALNKAAIDTLTIVEGFGALPSTEPVAKPVTNKQAAKDEYLQKVAEAIKTFKSNK